MLCRSRFALSCACCLAFLAGCSQPVGKVSGEVAQDGKPVEAGTINFVFLDKEGVTQSADLAAGSYSLPVPMPAGKYKVFLAPPVPVAQKEPPKKTAANPIDIPKKYLDLNTSDLIVEVKAGENKIPIALKD